MKTQTVACKDAALADGLVTPLPKVYTISRCKKDESLYGPVHWSTDAKTTFCGLDLTVKAWLILSNNFDGEATCSRCQKVSSTCNASAAAKDLTVTKSILEHAQAALPL